MVGVRTSLVPLNLRPEREGLHERRDRPSEQRLLPVPGFQLGEPRVDAFAPAFQWKGREFLQRCVVCHYRP
ncbi:hypothetical protein [Rhodococcus sp. BS-15]|uniref:hypothetical protein n=1 Tax=Rhodococcus sp. BS-15 TaxID=1304954 RepID=UPI000FFB84FC|nr:hypothetical protein [Rhodococcus sp. BS-15]